MPNRRIATITLFAVSGSILGFPLPAAEADRSAEAKPPRVISPLPQHPVKPSSIVMGQKQSRRYDKDGNPEVDVDTGHDHGAGNDHAHDWTNSVRGPGRPVQPGDPPVPKGYGK